MEAVRRTEIRTDGDVREKKTFLRFYNVRSSKKNIPASKEGIFTLKKPLNRK